MEAKAATILIFERSNSLCACAHVCVDIFLYLCVGTFVHLCVNAFVYVINFLFCKNLLYLL